MSPRQARAISRGSSSSQATAHYRYALGAGLSQIADSGQYIQVKRRAHRVGVPRASRLTVATKVERQHAKSRRSKGSRLLLPALLIEATPVGQHDSSVTFSVKVSVDYASVVGGKRHGRLCGGGHRKQQGKNDGDEPKHAANVPLMAALVIDTFLKLFYSLPARKTEFKGGSRASENKSLEIANPLHSGRPQDP